MITEAYTEISARKILKISFLMLFMDLKGHLGMMNPITLQKEFRQPQKFYICQV